MGSRVQDGLVDLAVGYLIGELVLVIVDCIVVKVVAPEDLCWQVGGPCLDGVACLLCHSLQCHNLETCTVLFKTGELCIFPNKWCFLPFPGLRSCLEAEFKA